MFLKIHLISSLLDQSAKSRTITLSGYGKFIIYYLFFGWFGLVTQKYHINIPPLNLSAFSYTLRILAKYKCLLEIYLTLYFYQI